VVFLLGLAIVSGVIGATPEANAAFVMTLDDVNTSGVDVIVVDNTDGSIGTSTSAGYSNKYDLSSIDGIVRYSGSVGNFSVQITTALSKPFVGNPALARIDVTNVSVTASAAGQLAIGVTDTGFLLTGQELGSSIQLTNILGGTTDGSVNSIGYLGGNNQEFEIGSLSTGAIGSSAPGSFSGTSSKVGDSPAEAFALSEFISVTHTGAGQITTFTKRLEAAVVSVPEPSATVALSLALLGIAGYYHWDRKRS